MKLLRDIRKRLKRRPDSEFEQAVLRIALGTVLFAYMLFDFEYVQQRNLEVFFYAGGGAFYLAAVTLIVLVCFSTTASPARRIVGSITDAFGITLSMHLGGEPAAAFFLAYLWVTLGNGFRYGSDYLLISLALSVAGFASALHSNPFWSQHLILGWEMLIGMIGVALYARMLVIKLNRATRRAEAANEAKRAFVSRMSHEMRTPLTSILGLAELLGGTRLKPDQRQMASLVRESSLHLKSLVDDILDFSKIEAGKMVLERGELSVRALLWTVAGIVSPQARAKGLRLDLRLAPDLPERVVSDEVRLRQVLLNLVGNAVKFTREGSITLGVEVKERGEATARLRFWVEDTGIGIPAEKLPYIFDSFTQADEGVTRRYGGSGLGTTIAKQIVELMGGTMGAHSEVGRGSTFFFELPLDVIADPSEEGAPDVPRWALVGFAPERARELAAMLDSWGVQHVEIAIDDGPAARAETRLAGVFLAWQAADSANSAVRTLRRPDRFGAVPVVVCSDTQALLDQPPPEAANVLAWPLQRFDVFSAVHLLSRSAGTREIDLGDVQAETPEEAPRQPERALQVLIIDDTATNRFVLQSILERFGHRCDALATPGEALDRFVETRYDAVICDRNMPEMDGVELVRELRALDVAAGGATAMLMLTGDATAGARDAAIAAGVDEFLTKPVRPQELLGALERAVDRRGKSAPAPMPSPAAMPAVGEGTLIDARAVDELARLRPDDPDFVHGLHMRFISDAHRWSELVRSAIDERRIAPVKEAVHSLEGDAGSLGLERIAAVCRAHRGLSEGDLDGPARRFANALDEVLASTEAALAAHRASRITAGSVGTNSSP